MNRCFLLIPLLFILTGRISAQEIDSSGVWKMVPGTTATSSTTVDTTAGRANNGTNPDSSAIAAKDSTGQVLQASNLKLIRRNYNSRQQVLLASGMMAFVVIIMTLAQQFNPE